MPVVHSMWIYILAVVYCEISWASSVDICNKNWCEYQFIVRETRSMMYTSRGARSYKVILADNGSLMLSPTNFYSHVPDIVVPVDEVHTTDGHTRTILTINNQFPGPAIEVMEGARVVVNVVNELQDGLTIHWHGMHMKNNPWMDGSAYISQCPIQPKTSFQYRFIASPAGTHWYHSHFVAQRADGVFGALIVHRSRPSLPYMTMLINDWYSMLSSELLLRSPFQLPRKGVGDIFDDVTKRNYIFDGTETTALRYWSGLINGRGRHENNRAPLSVFKVQPGQKYRIHLVLASLEYNYRFSVDQHKLTVVETDGHPVKPVQVDSLIGFMGERFVVELNTDQAVGRYWVRATVLRTGVTKNPVLDNKTLETLAILHYDGANENIEPSTKPRECTEKQPCVIVNCPWSHYHNTWYPNRQCVPISSLRLDKNLTHATEKYNSEEDVFEIFLNFGFSFGSSINSHRHIMPRAPLFQDRNTWGTTECTADCVDKGCLCTNVVSIPANRIVQIVLSSNSLQNTLKNGTISDVLTMHHPVHVHGHSFQVIKIGFPISNQQTGRIEKQNPDLVCDNVACSRQRWAAGQPAGLNTNDPPIKDTVVIPAHGYVVIRFKSDNPGYWFLHCHQILHTVEGMSLILNQSQAHLPLPPANFPTCTDFNMSNHEFELMIERNKQCALKECEKDTKSQANTFIAMDIWMYLMLLHYVIIIH